MAEIVATTHYIYALYSGRFQIKGTHYWWGNTIHVFDWNGTPVCQINLNQDETELHYLKNSRNTLPALQLIEP